VPVGWRLRSAYSTRREPFVRGLRLSGVRTYRGSPVVGVCLIGLIGSLSGCGGRGAITPPESAPASSVGGSGSQRGLLPAAPRLHVRLQLQQSHVVAGATIPGKLIITNGGHVPVNLTSGCRPKYQVVLTNRQIPPSAPFTTECYTAPFIIPAGSSTLGVTVQSTYSSCLSKGGQSTRPFPACRADGQPPPLPSGSYQAVLIGTGLPLPDPPPVTVDIGAS